MKKITFLTTLSTLILFFSVGKIDAQVTIGADVAPQPFSVLELMGQYETGTYGGLRLPQLSTTERDAIAGLASSVAEGLMIFNTTTKCIEFWNGTAWKFLCDSGTGSGTDPGTGGDTDPWGHIECGAYIAPGVWKKFMCRNLGADPNAHPFYPSPGLNGDYYQWGSPIPAATFDEIIGVWNTETPFGWYGDNTDGANVIVKSVFDPCPPGYRVPSYNEWQGVLDNNPITNVGSWDYDSWSGNMFGNALFLPAAGRRDPNDGSLTFRGMNGTYRSSRIFSPLYNYSMTFDDEDGIMGFNSPTFGYSIRCIAE
ncbi:MAG: fibrobacter succinogenes major paralogous domain-containing protein [Bacteroidales bacterium]|jgi:hypothetical protein|nr:fibrobacter succinogenes major paralogous domain-containing protein [Bacteroidales bacterium]